MSISLKKTILFAAIDLPILFYGYEVYGKSWTTFFVTFLATSIIYLPLAYLIWDRYNKEAETETVAS